MAVDWKDPEVKDRLLAAIIASMGGTVNCKEVARLYGGKATYSAIENFLRKPKQKARDLIAKAEGRPAAAASPARPRKTPGTPMTPKTPKDVLLGFQRPVGSWEMVWFRKCADEDVGVKTGRVIKTTPKKNVTSPVKKEFFEEELAGAGVVDRDTELDNEI
ncbi:hypothetical protein BU23DRAFT_636102 [Bimuria novae-zelandiae CBS 107.79]|uniref:Uncharacterized protein n=1 Tax=Bimuria novae-zelandiae CBS 107.79 TaxID=1447943 RepID=A0A6A5VBJ7_9PLEO|nr:hypothetical protein BU23DRAFT_636102 [Bimuria novae-zelandiae CBS 107.79]